MPILQPEDDRTCQQAITLLDSVTDSILGIDSDWTISYVNKATERFYDLPRQCLLGRGFWDVFPQISQLYEQLDKAMREREAIYFEALSVARSDRWVGVHVYPAKEGITLFVRDITRRKQMESALRQQEREFSTLVENSPDVIARYDREGRHLYVNPRFTVATGLSFSAVIGKTWAELAVEAELSEQMSCHFTEVFKTGSPVVFETQFQNKLGAKRAFQIHAAPEFGSDCRVKSILAIARDITDHRQLERDMARLERMNLIGEMAASIGHEVRNPMTTVRGFMQMFKGKKEFAGYGEYLDLMIEELDRANGIITEFLSLAKNRAVELKLANLNDVIRSLYPLLHADALRRGQELLLALDNIPNLLIDEKDIRQLILNLVRNALEAMESGGQVQIATVQNEEEVLLIVRDQGKGIPADVIEQLGTPFFTTKEKGTGLGLPVCYRIADRHQAKINFETSDAGTAVFVRFKTAVPAEL